MDGDDEGRALLGQTIGGKYFVRSILGRGGMGTVYEGVNVQMGRVVALKVLHPKQVRKRESVKRFYQEARAAGAIGHPNICEVYDLGTLEDGCPYLVMERLVGSTLSQHVRSSVLPFQAAIDIIIQVLSGLVVAHDKGIVHRDLKPDNIFLTERVGFPPVAKVLDFGVSKVVSSAPDEPRDADLDLTRTGMVMGTPYYMSPEQASGARDLDGRVDLYACGVILYETLTGRRPFLGANYHILLWNILKTEPPAPSELRPDLPSALEAVIARAMARDRAARYTSAHEFIAALSHVRANLATSGAGSSHRNPALSSATVPGFRAPAPATAFTPPAFTPPPFTRPTSTVPPGPPAPSRPPTGGAPRLHSRPLPRGFEDLSTEIDGRRDFAPAGDESDVATTLMKEEDVAIIAETVRELAKSAALRAPRAVDPYNDETVKMDPPELPPATVRLPRRK